MQTRSLGGEAGRRGFIGGTYSKARRWGLIAVGVLGLFAVMYLGLVGLAATLLAVAVVFVATLDTDSGTLLSSWQRRRAWRERRRLGTDRFRPVRDRPAELVEPGRTRSERRSRARAFAAYRDAPEGMDGFAWLQQAPGLPGIGWHAPTGEDRWLTVVWSVSGQVRGLRGDAYLEAGMAAFGRLLARYGSPAALPSRIQVITRALPVDPIPHEAWVFGQQAEDPPLALLRSYEELVETATSHGLTQRHYVVVRWPITSRFLTLAAARGPDLDGWRALMADEITATTRHLAGAQLGRVQVLSARGVAAVLRHLQMPAWPVDQVGDVDPWCPWFPIDPDGPTAVVVSGADPAGVRRRVWHRTAVVPIRAVQTGPRTPLWFTPLLSELREPIVRTVSVQIEMQPAGDAREIARSDVTSDLADIQSQAAKGVLVGDELRVSQDAARQRLVDLRPGSGHAGAGWAMHLTVSADSRRELDEAAAKLEAAAVDAGIEQLEWLDYAQEAALACTWPVARGMAPVKRSSAGAVRELVASRTQDKEQGGDRNGVAATSA